ncbi:hypothetical protein BDZ97DRAFT_1666706 [Flammula alnicola]|nr:hypothetical protein BDZ97DRAFT_1666706 [Flammula alnicola]
MQPAISKPELTDAKSSTDVALCTEVSRLARLLARDQVYYFEVIVFEVEGTLFRVPKNGFEVPGSFFETLFSLPGPGKNGTHMEGTDDTCPIVIEGISKDHFRSFLSVMYPFKRTASTYEEWLGVLHLATQWDFTEFREKSVRALTVLIRPGNRTVTDNILLAKKYKVKNWLIQGYTSLIQQPKPLNLDQLCASMIDTLTIARLLSIRESIHMKRMIRLSHLVGNVTYGPTLTPYGVTDEEAVRLVSQMFASEIAEMA